MIKDLFKTCEMIKDLDFCDQNSFPLLFQFKQENDQAERVLMHEVTDEFNKGKINPKFYEGVEKIHRQVANKRRLAQRNANAKS